MYIVAGSAMVALGLIGVSLLAFMFRSPKTPRWLNSDLVAMLLCIPVTALMGLGAGYILIGLSHGIGVVQVVALTAAPPCCGASGGCSSGICPRRRWSAPPGSA